MPDDLSPQILQGIISIWATEKKEKEKRNSQDFLGCHQAQHDTSATAVCRYMKQRGASNKSVPCHTATDKTTQFYRGDHLNSEYNPLQTIAITLSVQTAQRENAHSLTFTHTHTHTLQQTVQGAISVQLLDKEHPLSTGSDSFQELLRIKTPAVSFRDEGRAQKTLWVMISGATAAKWYIVYNIHWTHSGPHTHLYSVKQYAEQQAFNSTETPFLLPCIS